MSYPNMNDRFDPVFCEDEEAVFYVSMLGSMQELIDTLEEMREAVEHEIVRRDYLD